MNITNNKFNNPEVYVESYVALNGRLSQKYIDKNEPNKRKWKFQTQNLDTAFQHN
jgi:hypothetical protein